MLKLAGRCPAMKRTQCAAMVEKIKIYVFMFCASLYRTRDAKIDMDFATTVHEILRLWLSQLIPVTKLKMCAFNARPHLTGH